MQRKAHAADVVRGLAYDGGAAAAREASRRRRLLVATGVERCDAGLSLP